MREPRVIEGNRLRGLALLLRTGTPVSFAVKSLMYLGYWQEGAVDATPDGMVWTDEKAKADYEIACRAVGEDP